MFKKIALVFITFIILLMGAIVVFSKDIEITVSEAEAQSAINDFMTQEGHVSLGVSIFPKNISIDFKASNRAKIKSDVALDGHGYAGQFSGEFASGINYHRPRLYLDDLKLIDGGFTTDETTQSELEDLKKVAADILRRQREERKPEDPNIAFDNSKAKNTQLVEKFTVSATKAFLENIPIYNVANSGKTGLAASLALKDVRFTEDAAIITLNPVTALLRILAMLGIVCLVLLYASWSILITLFISRLKGSKPKD